MADDGSPSEEEETDRNKKLEKEVNGTRERHERAARGIIPGVIEVGQRDRQK